MWNQEISKIQSRRQKAASQFTRSVEFIPVTNAERPTGKMTELCVSLLQVKFLDVTLVFKTKPDPSFFLTQAYSACPEYPQLGWKQTDKIRKHRHALTHVHGSQSDNTAANAS